MEPYLFSIVCPTCQRTLAVRDEAAIGAILPCGRCGSMVEVIPPKGWRPKPPAAPAATEILEPNSAQESPTSCSPSDLTTPGAATQAKTAEGLGVERTIQPPAVANQIPCTSAESGAVARMVPGVALGKLLVAAIPVVALAVAVAAWAVLSSTGDEQPEAEAVADTIEPATSPEQPPPPAAAEPPPRQFDRRWLPSQTRCLVSLRMSEIPEHEWVEQLLGAAEPVWRDVAGRVLETFGLKRAGVRRLTWAACDLAAWREQAVVLIELEEPQTTARLREAGESSGLTLASTVCRRFSKASWSHPFAVLDDRTLVTGPVELLREVSAEGPAKLKSDPIERLLKLGTWEGHFALLDLAAARQAGWSLPAAWLDVWPAGRESWHTVCESPQGVGVVLRGAPRPATAVVLLCDGESAADRVRGAIDQLVPAARSSLDGLKAALAKKVQAGRIRA
ncbi:MAG: hypothetical protein NUV77_15325, partial [Thermoguttaceae bacterium]|nr:hypothetical protein [Thermoguttaceae bacterium]